MTFKTTTLIKEGTEFVLFRARILIEIILHTKKRGRGGNNHYKEHSTAFSQLYFAILQVTDVASSFVNSVINRSLIATVNSDQ